MTEVIRTDNTDVIANACKKIAELEQKNAVLENGFRICEKNADTYYDQLTKAKELLNEFMRISVASVEEYEPEFSELIKRAEQFLKEIEK